MNRAARGLVLIALLLALPAAAESIGGSAAQPRPLAGHGVENLSAFARLLALVRFFHPSDAVAAASWNRVAVSGVDAVEGAESPEALARALETFFHPLAPTLRVLPSGQPPGLPEIPPELRKPTVGGPYKIVAQRHFGGHFDGTSKVFRSERIDDQSPPGFGTLVQLVAAGPLRGRRVRLRANIRAEIQPGGFAQLGLRVDRAGGERGFLDNMADRPIRSSAWQTYEIEGDVAPDAERIAVLLVLTGSGKVWLDDVAILPVTSSPSEDGGAGSPLVHLLNAGFEEGETGRQPPGWYFPYEAVGAGYHLLLRRGEPCLHGGCALVASDGIAAPRIPRPQEVWEADLGGGVTAAVPLALWADAGGTLPQARAGEPVAPWAGTDAASDTRAARLATVALYWGIQQHLHPELDPGSRDWVAALPEALDGAARAADRDAFRRVLHRLAAPLHDLKADTFGHRDDPPSAYLPLAWAWIEEQLVVTGVGTAASAAGLRPGDVVVTIDGRPASAAVREAEELASGASPGIRRWLAVATVAAGQAASRASLTLVHLRGGPTFTATLARTAGEDVRDTPVPALAEPSPGILYVDLRRTSQESFDELLTRLAAADGVVFDLRGRTQITTTLLSHLTGSEAQSPNWQIPVVMLPDHRDVKWLSTFWTIQPKEPRIRGKVAFLVDERSSGYSETLLAMVESYRWAETVGTVTAGDNGSRNWSELPGGWTIPWTGQRVLKHDGSPFHGVGVKPTVEVRRTIEGIAAGRDEVVERAVEVVGARSQ